MFKVWRRAQNIRRPVSVDVGQIGDTDQDPPVDSVNISGFQLFTEGRRLHNSCDGKPRLSRCVLGSEEAIPSLFQSKQRSRRLHDVTSKPTLFKVIAKETAIDRGQIRGSVTCKTNSG